MDTTGEFKIDDENPYHCKWLNDEAYRLERVSDFAGILRVPVKPAELFALDDQRTPETVNAFAKTTIVLGEPGSGMATFRQWLLKKPDTFALFDQVLSARLAIETMVDANARHLVLDLTAQRSSRSTSSEEQADIGWLIGTLEKPQWVNLRTRSRLIVLTRSVEHLRTNELFSYVSARGQTMRVPHFTMVEMELWAEALANKLRPGHADIAKAIEANKNDVAAMARRWTGGQAHLTHNLFCLVERALVERRANILEVFDEEGEYLRNHAPRIVASWQKQLEALFETRPTIRKTLRSYMSGRTKDPSQQSAFTDDDVDLFLAGWVGVNNAGKWGIRSQCHALWAQAVR